MCDSQVVKVQLKREAQMASELERIDHPDKLVSLRVLSECRQHFDLGTSLQVKAALVADDLQCHPLSCLVVQCLVHVAKRTLAEFREDLVPKGNVVADRCEIPGLLVVVSTVLNSPREETLCWNEEDLQGW